MTFIDGARKGCFVLTVGLLTACSGQSPEDVGVASTDAPQSESKKKADVGETKHALGSVFFEGSCTNGQKRDLETFHGWLSGYVSDAFWNWSSYPGRRQQAFGNMSSSDTSHVYQTLDNMDYWLENESFTYSCETDGLCGSGSVGAWVYDNHVDNTFHICPAWWDQDNQWRLFILTHELSHLAGTDDWTYPGYDDWTSSFIFQAYFPDIAAQNANNYALYVMNPFGWPN